MSEQISTLDDMLVVQLVNVKDDPSDSYMLGMYNGMEFARSIMVGCEPIYVDKDGKLDSEAVERSPERFI